MNRPETGKLVRRLLPFERDYTQVPNDWARDNRLSFKARGILTYLLSQKPGWSMTIRDLAGKSKDGKAAVATGLGELKSLGYLVMRPVYDQRNRRAGVNWELWDDGTVPPIPEPLPGMELSTGSKREQENPWSAPEPDFQDPDFQDPDFPAPENRDANRRLFTEDLTQEVPEPTTDGPVENSTPGVSPRPRCFYWPDGRHRFAAASGWCDCGLRDDGTGRVHVSGGAFA